MWISYNSITVSSDLLAKGQLSWGPAFLYLAIKQIVSIGAVLAIGLAYLKWVNSVYQKQSTAEMTLHQTALDIERANWVVESLLEWKKSGEQQMPEQLLSAVTKGLFEAGTKSHDIELSAADQLASILLGTASRVEVNTGVAKVEYDGKSLKKLQKE